MIPPLFLFIGTYLFGWHIGAEHPVNVDLDVLCFVCLTYWVILFVGILGLGFISRWMAPTYAGTLAIGPHLALIVSSAAPLMLGSVAHLYPHVILNTLVFIPVALWSLLILYRAVPVLLSTDPQRGMLHASSLVGVVLVAAVSLLGLSVGLWTVGFGPNIGV